VVQVGVDALGETVSRDSASNPSYKLYHPRWYRVRMPIFWWLKKLSYSKFITRELTSLSVGYAAVLLLAQVWILSLGRETYERFQDLLRSPAVLAFHALVLLSLLFHTITWLNLAPRALVLHLGRLRVPDAAVLAGHYVAWLAATSLVVWYLLG